MKEEPAYMMVARSNARAGVVTSSAVVDMLVARIDRLETEQKEVAKSKIYRKDDRIFHVTKGSGRVYQDQNGFTHVYVVFDNDPFVTVSVDPKDLR